MGSWKNVWGTRRQILFTQVLLFPSFSSFSKVNVCCAGRKCAFIDPTDYKWAWLESLRCLFEVPGQNGSFSSPSSHVKINLLIVYLMRLESITSCHSLEKAEILLFYCSYYIIKEELSDVQQLEIKVHPDTQDSLLMLASEIFINMFCKTIVHARHDLRSLKNALCLKSLCVWVSEDF